jgi:hypothetical protein
VAVLTGRVAQSQLHGVTPADPANLGSAVLFVEDDAGGVSFTYPGGGPRLPAAQTRPRCGVPVAGAAPGSACAAPGPESLWSRRRGSSVNSTGHRPAGASRGGRLRAPRDWLGSGERAFVRAILAYGSVPEARLQLGRYFRFYNHERPHQALACRTPAPVYAEAKVALVSLRGASGSDEAFAPVNGQKILTVAAPILL